MSVPASAIVAVRADERSTTGALVDPAILQISGPLQSAAHRADPDELSDLVERIVRPARRDSVALAGLAFASPGGHAWDAVGAALAERFGLPWSRHPLAHATLRGEQIHGAARGLDSALLFDTDILRIGLLLDGRPYEGAGGAAGDVAHLGLDRTGQTVCACGRTGCLAALVHPGLETPEPPLPFGASSAPSRPHGWLAVAGIALINMLNPQLLILDGSATEREPEFRWLAETIRLAILAPTRAGLVAVARARSESALLGAAAGFLAVPPRGVRPNQAT